MVTVFFILISASFTVRLVGDMPYRGRAEVLVAGEWGTICDDDFDNLDAEVFCRMLGYRNGFALGGASYGMGEGSIWLDGIDCKGTENNLNECAHSKLGYNDCMHEEDVGVWCSRK